MRNQNNYPPLKQLIALIINKRKDSSVFSNNRLYALGVCGSKNNNDFRGFKIVLKLNENVSKAVVENYRVSVRVVPNKNEVVKKQLKEQ